MEHSVSDKTETVIGFDLERKILIVESPGGGGTIVSALTDDQVFQIRSHWKWLRAAEARKAKADDLSSHAE